MSSPAPVRNPWSWVPTSYLSEGIPFAMVIWVAGTMFKERIAHGMLSAAYISAVFGMKLPGPGAIYISQTLNFKAPVKIGDTVVTTVKVIELIAEKKRARFETVCSVNGKAVVQGEAVLMVPTRPA